MVDYNIVCSVFDHTFSYESSCESHCYQYCGYDFVYGYCCPYGSYYSSYTGPWWISIIVIAFFIIFGLGVWQTIVRRKRMIQMMGGQNAVIVKGAGYGGTQVITMQQPAMQQTRMQPVQYQQQQQMYQQQPQQMYQQQQPQQMFQQPQPVVAQQSMNQMPQMPTMPHNAQINMPAVM
ncbi:Hypothetical_protein [Hexamita inflata]|uniref:Hypothetical_protein n=1 Tax=Hexamita inflata TaxID=28002 RepID=A0AA86R5T4_9EUKA|nr:Hypothetical protein HINF_LOCUS59884 [Hexamita inflata]